MSQSVQHGAWSHTFEVADWEKGKRFRADGRRVWWYEGNRVNVMWDVAA
jgi:hypothetical protein